MKASKYQVKQNKGEAILTPQIAMLTPIPLKFRIYP